MRRFVRVGPPRQKTRRHGGVKNLDNDATGLRPSVYGEPDSIGDDEVLEAVGAGTRELFIILLNAP